MALAVITLDFITRQLVVLEDGQEQVWPIDTLQNSENWNKLSQACQRKLLNFLHHTPSVNKNIRTENGLKTAL
jgi:putative SOS response-associated peptidase YedK